MTEPNIVKMATSEKIREAVDRYALAVGRVFGGWNYLHRILGGFFAVLFQGDVPVTLAAWRSIENDRAQREMLRASINHACPKRWEKTPDASADLLWVLDLLDHRFSDVRNNAIHALVSVYGGGETVEVNVAMPVRGKREKNCLIGR